MLSDRRQRVLAALIEEYVARALPVGSRTLTERYHLGVSPATVRNELSVLEEGGYIVQPHTSAGRVPTDFGYRAFVDNLLDTGLVSRDDRYLDTIRQMQYAASELDELLERTSVALTSLTNCLSVVMAPTVLRLRVKQVSLISLSPYTALVVLVTEDGQVFNRQMDFDVAVDATDLSFVQNYLNEALCGASLDDIETGLSRGLDESFRNPLMRMALSEVMSMLQEGSGAHSYRLGLSALLGQPEFSQTQAVLPVIQMLEDDAVLLQILDDAATPGHEPSVRIGTENRNEQLSGVSVVASRYGREDGGVVAVIGPTRMDYSRVIRAVKAASETLEDL